MPTFAQIQAEIANILDVPEEQMTEEQKAAWDAYADELGNMQADKIDAYSQARRLGLAQADDIEEEGKRLIAKARAMRNSFARSDKYVLFHMEANGEKKISGKHYSISRRENTFVNVKDENVLPAEYVRTTVTTAPDKAAIKAALKDGVEVPGAELAKSYSLQVA